MEKKKKGFKLFHVYVLTLLWLEVCYHVMIFGIKELFNISFIYYLMFSIIISLVLTMISKLFSEKTNKIITIVITIITTILYCTHLVFKKIFNTFFSFTLFKIADQAVTFTGTAILEIIKMLPLIILLFIPLILLIIFKNKVNFNKASKLKFFIKRIVALIIMIVLFMVCVNKGGFAHDLFYNVDNPSLNFEKLGVNVSVYLDLKRSIFGFNEKMEEIVPIKEKKNDDYNEKVVEYNNLDINFEELYNNEKNSTLKNMHAYFMNEEGTEKNDYTGLYKGKNIVMVMGESLNTIAISEKYTPTLYKMANNGFVFNNFYTPVNMSTIGGEFQNLTGLFANLSMLSNKWRAGNNYFPFGVAKLFKDSGYKAYAYHPNSAYFQDRDKYLKSVGFDYFKAKNTGLEKLMNCNVWPQSDYDMVDVTTSDFIDNEEPFLAYYVSVSGHMPWGWDTNNMSRKNKDLLKDSGYSEEAAAYIASNIELDKAMELLINRLEEKNKLDDTVFVIVADHYPYSMNINTINELSDFKRDSVIGVNKSTFILWNSKQDKIEINKPVTQLDALPTVYNLFGLSYDSRLIIGKDALSNYPGLVYFTDRSWISEKGTYRATTGKFDGEEVDDDYIKNINKDVQNRINMSKYIMEYDYYKKVLGE